MFQSTHPHGVRLNIFSTKSMTLRVSIHAPTRGATEEVSSPSPTLIVSIHAPTRGATDDFLTLHYANWFQSTHPHGVRRNRKLPGELKKMFQSTHPHGVRPIKRSSVRYGFRFQSTHPHGVRRVTRIERRETHSFNPRTHTGCDVLGPSPKARPKAVSIHAPTRGATSDGGCITVLLYSFNPRTHTGCDCQIGYLKDGTVCFNPRTHTGCDLSAGGEVWIGGVFQSTHPHGVRLKWHELS